MDFWYAIILGIIEGVTEFLPISSTGHLRLAQNWMAIDLEDRFWSTFAVFIQIGAIAAVVVYFRRRIVELLRGGRQTNSIDPPAAGGGAALAATAAPPAVGASAARILLLLAVGTFPVLLVGYLADDFVEANLSSTWPIAMALGIGGVMMALIEWFPMPIRARRMEQVTIAQAVGIGIIQILAAIFPGTSRSAATILGGMFVGLSREAATEFSFFLAIPAMFAACSYKLLKQLNDGGMSGHQVVILVIGTVVSFFVAWAVIAWLMQYVRRHNFLPFAAYRIVLALLVLALTR